MDLAESCARNPHDRFGKVMVKNLAERGCPLLSVYDYPSMEAQKERFLARGWTRCQVADMNEIYRSHLDQSEVGISQVICGNITVEFLDAFFFLNAFEEPTRW